MARVQSRNDRTAFTELVQRWEGPIRQACYRILLDRHRSEELTQDTFTRLYLRREQFRSGGKFSTYLWQIAINLCRDELRRRANQQRLLDPELAEPTIPAESDPFQDAATEERAEAVRAAIAALPDTLRIITVMRHYQDLKFREIATALDLPEGTVKTRMVQAMKQLNHSLHSLRESGPQLAPSLKTSVTT